MSKKRATAWHRMASEPGRAMSPVLVLGGTEPSRLPAAPGAARRRWLVLPRWHAGTQLPRCPLRHRHGIPAATPLPAHYSHPLILCFPSSISFSPCSVCSPTGARVAAGHPGASPGRLGAGSSPFPAYTSRCLQPRGRIPGPRDAGTLGHQALGHLSHPKASSGCGISAPCGVLPLFPLKFFAEGEGPRPAGTPNRGGGWGGCQILGGPPAPVSQHRGLFWGPQGREPVRWGGTEPVPCQRGCAGDTVSRFGSHRPHRGGFFMNEAGGSGGRC